MLTYYILNVVTSIDNKSFTPYHTRIWTSSELWLSLSPQVKGMKENLAACYFDSLRKRLLRHFEINNGLIIFSWRQIAVGP